MNIEMAKKVSTFSLPISNSLCLFRIETPLPEMGFSIIGSFGFKADNINGYQTGYFLLSNKEDFYKKTYVDETKLVKKITHALESNTQDNTITIIDIMLPKALGFNGRKILLNSLGI